MILAAFAGFVGDRLRRHWESRRCSNQRPGDQRPGSSHCRRRGSRTIKRNSDCRNLHSCMGM
eukprot:8378358-Heterocapsa_arctica.AAC.1